jgi:hypothetical protein
MNIFIGNVTCKQVHDMSRVDDFELFSENCWL